MNSSNHHDMGPTVGYPFLGIGGQLIRTRRLNGGVAHQWEHHTSQVPMCHVMVWRINESDVVRNTRHVPMCDVRVAGNFHFRGFLMLESIWKIE